MRRKLYEVQRAMRARREAALRRGVVAVLDVGSSKVACLVLQFVPDDAGAEDGRPTLTQGAFRVIGAANTRSRGVRFGEIAEMEETERAVMTAIQAAQKMANLRVDHVIVAFSGGRPRSYGVIGEAEVMNGAVRERDIGEVLAVVRASRLRRTTARCSTRCPSTSCSTGGPGSPTRAARWASVSRSTCTC
jgi:cell division protein FtsA